MRLNTPLIFKHAKPHAAHLATKYKTHYSHWAHSKLFACMAGLAFAAMTPHAAAANEDLLSATYRGWWRGTVQEEFFVGSCHVKAYGGKDSTPPFSERNYQRKITCQNGEGANWHGTWKTQFRQGNCLIEQSAKPEVFEEKINCSR